MEVLDRKELGNILRGIRKKKGLTIEMLHSPDLSGSTISKIENGRPQVKEEMIKIYCEKLGYDIKNAPTLSGDEFKTKEELEQEFNRTILIAAENFLRANEHKKALEKLKSLDLHPNDILRAKYHFLQANICFAKSKFGEAAKQYNKTIKLANSNMDLYKKTNMIANCYLQLSRLDARSNQVKTALKKIDLALKSFDANGERKFLKPIIMMNQAIYLERLNKREKALDIIKDLWKDMDQIEHIDVKLNMYDVRAIILSKSELYEEAIGFAKAGIDLAVLNRQHGVAGELWKTLGSIYKMMNQYNLAIECLETAKFLLNKFDKKHQLLVVDSELADIYNSKKFWRKAQRLLQSSLANVDKSRVHMIRYNQALLTLGVSCFYLEEYEECQRNYELAYELSKKHDFKSLEFQSLVKLGELWEKRDPTKFQEHLHEIYQATKQLNKGGN